VSTWTIVDDLRQQAAILGFDSGAGRTLLEGAAEIERLRTKLEKAWDERCRFKNDLGHSQTHNRVQEREYRERLSAANAHRLELASKLAALKGGAIGASGTPCDLCGQDYGHDPDCIVAEVAGQPVGEART
jgi:hypothetical protein